MIEHSTDHLERALANLVSQFRNKVAVEALVQPIAQAQQAEDALIDILESRDLDTATGAQLDGLGHIVGAERGGLADAAYRVVIRERIATNTSQSTVEDLLRVITLFDVGAPAGSWQIKDSGAASMIVELRKKARALSTAEATALAVFLRQARAAGVYAYLVWPDETAVGAQYFSFGPDPDADGNSFGFDTGGFVAATRI